MEKRKGAWMAHGPLRRSMSRALQPDDTMMRDMGLNLLTIVGFMFLALILLHVFTGFANVHSLRVYVGIFLFLECTVIGARLYFYLKRRRRGHSSLPPIIADVEKVVTATEEKAPGLPPTQPHFAFHSYDSIEIQPKELKQKRNSL